MKWYAKRDRSTHIKLSTLCYLVSSRWFSPVRFVYERCLQQFGLHFPKIGYVKKKRTLWWAWSKSKEFFLPSSPYAPFQHEKKLSALSGFRTKMATRPLAWKLCVTQGWVRRLYYLASTTRARFDIGAVVGALREHQGLCHKSRCLDCERGEWEIRSSTILIFLCIWLSLSICAPLLLPQTGHPTAFTISPPTAEPCLLPDSHPRTFPHSSAVANSHPPE